MSERETNAGGRFMDESRMQRARRLGRLSLGVLSQDRRLLIFPAVSVAVNLAVGGLSFLAAVQVAGDKNFRLLLVVAGLIASYPVTFAAMFSGVALATVLARTLDGEPVTVADGWRVARQRIGVIAAWTLVVCTVGGVLRVIEEYVPLGGKVAALVLDVSWSLATLFAVPILAYEGLAPRATVRRSVSIFRERWGEQLAGVVVIGLFGAFGTGVFIVLAFTGIVVGLLTSGVVGILLVVIGGGAFFAFQAVTVALGQVYRVFVYRSVALEQPGGPFRRADLERPFAPRRWWN